MKRIEKEVIKPISLVGCEQIFEKAGIQKSEYSTWNIGKIFKEAERLSQELNITCQETFIQI